MPSSKRQSQSRNSRRAPGSSRPSGANRRPTGAASNRRPPAAQESGLRRSVAEWSRGPLVFLSRQPTWLVPLVMVVLLLVGVAGPVVLAVMALLLVAAFLGWLGYLSWPVLSTTQRLIRCAAFAAVLVAIVGRIQGWL